MERPWENGQDFNDSCRSFCGYNFSAGIHNQTGPNTNDILQVGIGNKFLANERQLFQINNKQKQNKCLTTRIACTVWQLDKSHEHGLNCTKRR